MKIALAPDKFKGSLTGIEFCDVVAEGIHSVYPKVEIHKIPLADGGDGTIEILDYHLKGERIKIKVNDPLFRSTKASYFYIKSAEVAYIEMAEASGMNLLTKEEQNCMNTTTYGTGEMIQDAIDRGAKTIILGLGGSATNDCGIGMACALGYKFLDDTNKEINPIGKNLSAIKKIDSSDVNVALKKIKFRVACDVSNPLYGKDGAAHVYATQKGASLEEVNILNSGLEHFAKLITDSFNIDLQKIEGTGAAGGMGAGTIVFLNAELHSGIDLIKDLVGFDNYIKNADWIITGEGKLDNQTFSGKTIHGVMKSAKKFKIPVAAFCGIISLNSEQLNLMGISYAASIIDQAINIDDAIANSATYLSKITIDFTKKNLD